MLTYDEVVAAVGDAIDRGLVVSQQLGSLEIFNYTSRCTYDGAWNAVTMQCRGLIVDHDARQVLALPWRKFFNLGEPHAPETPTGDPHVTVKMDGSLGIHFHHQGRVRWATRGSFESPQAQAANAMWAVQHPDVRLPEEWTVHTEILHPSSKVIVDYDADGFVVLGARERLSGRDVPLHVVRDRLAPQGLIIVEELEHDLDACMALADELGEQHEGFVLRWPTADGLDDVRLKIKTRAYRELHKLLFGLTDRRIADLWFARDVATVQLLPEEHRESIEVLWGQLDAEAAVLSEVVDEVLDRLGDVERKEIAIRGRLMLQDAGHAELFGVMMARWMGRASETRELAYRARFARGPRRPAS